ncbi:MAG: 30S ribosomal protein S27ae [Candidatus Kariarchaeaceae archaeon]|jgi:ribosomal protein S27AE
MSEYFEIEGDKLKRKYKQCPDCGPGYKMGEHKDRHVCGNCSKTIVKK